MRKSVNGNGGGLSELSPATRRFEKKPLQTASIPVVRESSVTFKTVDGTELHGTPVRVTRHVVAFELYNPNVTLQFSESFNVFEITLQAQKIYSGRATIRNVVNAGSKIVYEATLKESDWTDVNFVSHADGRLAGEFKKFLQEWQKLYKVSPEFKVVMADMQTFLYDLRVWLERVELKIHAFANPLRAQLEREAAEVLAGPISQAIDLFINQFESIVGRLEADQHPGYYAYFRRHLHPLVLVSPFAQRTFAKPLGYAGDYEMVNMMIRSPYEGDTLFAKIINIWLLGQAPAQAHRNRVAHLERKLVEETVRARSEGRVATIFNLGCGPAQEVQRFLENHHIYEYADFTLVDFNEETLGVLNKILSGINRQLPKPATYRTIKKSVFTILKSGSDSLLPVSGGKYDYVYCAGLFDYLSDDVCKQMMNIFYDMLAPGGLLLATNASVVLNKSRPFKFSMEYILDWHLVYRDQQQFFNIRPDKADVDDVKVIAENTGTNLFLEVRKPKNG